jgi:dephospho-CoA kinase
VIPPLTPPPTPGAASGDPDADRAGGGTRPLVIGVLGGIASGKSRVARLLAGETGVVFDADALAREVLESDAVVRRIRERFGDDAVDGAGRPRRDVLAERAFRDPEARKALESWTHPAVRARISEGLEAARESGKFPVVLDVPLLLENDAQHGLATACDVLVFVDASDAERERRVRTKRGWAPGELRRREAAQWPLQQKRESASHVIPNDKSERELEDAVLRLRRELGLG